MIALPAFLTAEGVKVALRVLPWAALLPAFLLGQCSGADHVRDQAKAATAVATVEALKSTSVANSQSADERVADAIAIAETKQELTDAVANLPDEVPSLRRVSLGCARLRQAGTDVSSIPACTGSTGSAQAGADR